MLPTTRKPALKLSWFNLALFALVWPSILATPCAMPMLAESGSAHPCPPCPPQPCDEVAPGECGAQALEPLLPLDKTPLLALPGPASQVPAFVLVSAEPDAPPRDGSLIRAGPRAHLVHVQFNE